MSIGILPPGPPRATLPPGGSSSPKPNPQSKPTTQKTFSSPKNTSSFFTRFIIFFKSIVLGVIFGIPIQEDNNSFLNYFEQVNAAAQGLDNEHDQVLARITKLRDDSQNALKYSKDHNTTNIPPTSGVLESDRIRFLTGELGILRSEQQLQHNRFINWWMKILLEDPVKAIDILNDMDNTLSNKGRRPDFTVQDKAQETFDALHRIRELTIELSGKLGKKITIGTNSARPIDDTITSSQLEGSTPFITRGLLGGLPAELYGPVSLQKIAVPETKLSALNSNIISNSDGSGSLFLSNKVQRGIRLIKFLEDLPLEIDGKTTNFIDEFYTKAAKECANAEHKRLPGYLYDMAQHSDEAYYHHYTIITELIKRCVYDKIQGVKDENERKRLEQEGWKEFQKELKDNVDEGISKWQKVYDLKYKDLASKIDDPNYESDLAKALEDALPHVRLVGIGLDKEAYRIWKLGHNAQDHYALLKTDPARFARMATRGESIGFTIHYHNRFLTPFDRKRGGGLDEPEKKLNVVRLAANKPEVRRYVSELNKRLYSKRSMHTDISSFRNKSIELFAKDIYQYLDWRMLEYISLHYSNEQIEAIEKQRIEKNEKPVFCIKDSKVSFSDEFIANRNAETYGQNLKDYIEWTKTDFKGSGGLESELISIIETFLPKDISDGNIKRLLELANTDDGKKYLVPEAFFYPSEMFIINHKRSGGFGDRCFYPIAVFVDKRDMKYTQTSRNSDQSIEIPYTPQNGAENKGFKFFAEVGLNPDGQGYIELLFGNRDKDSGVDEYEQLIKDNKQFKALTGGGDSRSDIDALAAIIARGIKLSNGEVLGGLANPVMYLYTNQDLIKGVIRQFSEDLKTFKNRSIKDTGDKFYQVCKESFGMFALEKLSNGNYIKVKEFKNDGESVPEQNPKDGSYEFTEEDLISELRNKYQNNIARHNSPETYIFRMLEMLELVLGKYENFNPKDFAEAQKIYMRKLNGETTFSPKENWLLKRYEASIVEQKDAFMFPSNAPRSRVWREYRDPEGKYIVFRDKNANLLIDYCNGSTPTQFKGDLSTLQEVEIEEDIATGDFVYQDSATGSKVAYETPERLNTYLLEEKYMPSISAPQGILNNKFLNWIFGIGNKAKGEKNLETFVRNIPNLFNNLLKGSGAVMAVGGLVRIASKLFGGTGGFLYSIGYIISNCVRAVSAFGGALRGILKPHKYYEMFVGEMVNMVSSALPNGPKHLGIGLGNFLLFLGRGRERAQLSQELNNHSKNMLEGKFSATVDPRPYVRDLTEYSKNILLEQIEKAKNKGYSETVGKIFGHALSAIFTPVRIIKDILHDNRLITKVEKRKSEKSGQFYYGVSSPGHLMGAVGMLSGIGVIIGGLFGRIKGDDSGYNKLGKLAISFANSIPALGIMANGIEIATNPNGLPRMTRGLNGKDLKIDYLRAGLGQVIAGLGYLILPWFGLHKESVASMYDIVNGRYFLALDEEKMGSLQMAGTEVRRVHKFIQDPESQMHITLPAVQEVEKPIAA